jgi:hypothetical protein
MTASASFAVLCKFPALFRFHKRMARFRLRECVRAAIGATARTKES